MTRKPALRGAAALLAAIVVATVGVVLPPTASLALATHEGTPDLTLVTDTRYEVQPAERRVHVTVAITATNHLKDTATRRFFFDRAFLAVLPGTTAFRITGAAGTPKVVVSSSQPDHTLLRIDFGARLAAGASTTFALSFDLPDPGGAGNRDVRVGSTIASFPVWAYGTDATPGSRVSVALPADYEVTFLTGELGGPVVGADGLAVYQSGILEEPLGFYVYLVGDRPGAYVDRILSVPVGGSRASLIVQAWADDLEWAERVADLLERGLPELGRLIGLEWLETDPIFVREALSRTTGGYAGLYDPALGRIDIAYYAGPGVVLHEAAHGWFNGALLADRWANEAFASLYGSATATLLDVEIDDPVLTDEVAVGRIPLNEWAAIGDPQSKEESYGYAASLALARLIAERAGDGVLREVWAKASARVGAYQPMGGDASSPEIDGNEGVDGPPDWRGVLDLLEDTSGTSFADLWTEWVIRESDAPLIADRATTRARYDALVAAADDWRLPRLVRDALRAWQFGTANDLLDQSSDVLDLRAAIAREAAAAGLTPPSTLRPLFERGEGFSAALTEAASELAALDALARAERTRLREPGLIETLGLIGTEPARELEAARRAFERGDLETTATGAAAAMLAWTTAGGVGGGRAMSVGLLTLAAAIIALLLIRRRRGQTRGRRRQPMATPLEPRDSEMRRSWAAPATEATDTYATLADHSDEPAPEQDAQGEHPP